MIADFRFALRGLRRTPAFFGMAILTLGLGIAANTAIFSLFYQVLLRTLPVPDPERLVVFHSEGPGLPGGSDSDNSESVFSYPMYLKLREGAKSFKDVAERSSAVVQMTVDGAAERIRAEIVSGNFFETLGVQPRLGRLLSPADDSVRGGNPVAVLSYDGWTRRFGASPAVLNRKVLVNGLPFTIVGVAPEDFHGVVSGDSHEILLPTSMKAALTPGWNAYDRPSSRWMNIVGRLAPGASRERAEAELQPLYFAVFQDHLVQAGVHNQNALKRFAVVKLHLRAAAHGLNQLERQWRKPLLVLLAMVFLLLLIGCANLANLLMARAVNRAREIAIRLALGAGRTRIVRLLLAESLMVAFGGALLGLLLSPDLTRALLSLLPADATGGWLSASVNVPLLAFCAALMLAATLFFGLTPALQAIRPGTSPLGERTQSTGGAGARRILVASQIALSLVLLVAAGLFGRSLANLMLRSPGYRTDHLLTFAVDAGIGGYDLTRGMSLYRAAAQRVAGLPGVASVSFADAGPLSHSESSSNVAVEGYQKHGDDDATDCDHNAVAPSYFRTLGTALIAGREFDERDRLGSPKVAIVNEAFAKRFSLGSQVVGHHMSIGEGGPLDMEIVGLVVDQKSNNLREAVKPTFYVPYEQWLQDKQGQRAPRAMFFVRTNAGFDALSSSVRSTVGQLDASLPVYRLRSMDSVVAESVYTDRLISALSTAFGLFALLLTAVGLYGVIAYLVTRRTAEIGIRIALGAERRDIVGLVMREVMLLVVVGTVAGLAGAIVAGRAIQSQLFGVRALDPLVLTAAPIILGLVAVGAAFLPALRASRVQPLEALRHE